MAKSVQVQMHGPVLDGQGPKIMAAFLDEATEDVAQEAYDEVRQRLSSMLQHPTGHYESRVTIDRSGGGPQVTDGGVIYGPWLEGVGSRNTRSRFKGYSTFRKVRQEVQARAGDIAERVLPKYLDRLEG